MSMHEAIVFKIDKIEKHPNADKLGIVTVGGFTCCIRLDDFKPGDLAIYIEPDTVVPETEQFAFLGSRRRIKVQKLRGIISQGLIMPAPSGANVGDDVFELIGLIHYEPPIQCNTSGDNEFAPSIFAPIYDVENWRKYPDIIQEGEEVVITEKIHGANSRFVYHDGNIHVGSHRNWKREDYNNLWWQALKQNPAIAEWCMAHPSMVLYAEVYGQVQDLKYGAQKGEYRIAVFDILSGNQWLSVREAQEIQGNLSWVPIVFQGPFNKKEALELAEGDSLIEGAGHIREGVVVKPVVERTHPKIGRVQLKIVSNQYLQRK